MKKLWRLVRNINEHESIVFFLMWLGLSDLLSILAQWLYKPFAFGGSLFVGFLVASWITLFEVKQKPETESVNVFKDWTCVFPGKMGLSWKRSWGVGTKEDAEKEAAKNCNVVAVPVQLFETMQHYEQSFVVADGELNNWQVTAANITRKEKEENDKVVWTPPFVCSFTKEEANAIDDLCKLQELTETQVLRQALRLYQAWVLNKDIKNYKSKLPPHLEK